MQSISESKQCLLGVQHTAPTPLNSVNVAFVLGGTDHLGTSPFQGFLEHHLISYVQLCGLLCFAKFPAAIVSKLTCLKCNHLNRFNCTF